MQPRLRLREIDLPATDQALREDVNRLGALVGEMIAEQAGATFLAEVERLRRAAILRREAGESAEALALRLAGQPLPWAEALVRAFATWFNAVNLAERVHRIRRRRDYQKAAAAPQPGSLAQVCQELVAAGVGADDFAALLARLRLEPVFTAHPTEAVRRALLEKERDIVRCLVADIDRTRTPQERASDLAQIRTALTAGWQTAEHAPERPTVADELEHVSFYLVEVLYRVLPNFIESLERETGVQLGAGAPLRFASWVGGDMDGNPNVDAGTMRAALAAQRRWLVAAYRRDLQRLSSLLSQSQERIGVSAALTERLAHYQQLLGRSRMPTRHASMPYRQWLSLVSARLAASSRVHDDELDAPAYRDAGEFRADIQLVLDSLLANRGAHAGAFQVRRLLRRIDAFGLHLATLDLRQDSRVHAAALATLFDDPAWLQHPLPPACRESLARLLDDDAAAAVVELSGADAATRSVLDVFRARRELRALHGVEALGLYVVSMSRSADDVFAVLALARLAGDDPDTLDVAPLFETVDDLVRAPEILRALLAHPGYRRHIEARGRRQVVMLGYSDSAKDAGLPAARWAIQRCQIELMTVAAAAGIELRFFHGRGGSASRGGGKTERAIIAAPRGSIDGYFRVTEQGEVIHRKYGIRALALRNLEQMGGAVLRASLRPRPPEPREAQWRGLMDEIAGEARAVYRALVHEDARFVDYFRQATPIDVIERLKLGSRPAKRAAGGQAGIEALRAIPWVFAWSQNRASMTAWYGMGSGLMRVIERHGLPVLQEMARDWPFFATLLDDVEMVLAKSDMAIFACYSRRLAADALHEQYFPILDEEFNRTRQAVLRLRGAEELLAGDRRLALSIRLRNPYVDPISLLQVDLLYRWREAGRPDDALFHALVATVNGIAAGVQNTG